MNTIKKILLALPIFLLWVIYFFFTLDKRNEYWMAKQKGMACVDSKDASNILHGSVREYTYDINKLPEKDYVSWSQFWSRFNFWNQTSTQSGIKKE